MKIWLDDERTAPVGWTWYRDAASLIEDLADEDFWYRVTHMSLDHDLGTEATGMDVVNALESWILESHRHARFFVVVHSQNPVGSARMAQALTKLRVNDPDVLHTVSGPLRTHTAEHCAGPVCAVHRPTEHHMRRWPMVWRSERALLERLCPHGVGHPDPDHLAFIRQKYGELEAHYESVHGCDGCCNH